MDTVLPPAKGDLVLAIIEQWLTIERYKEDENGNKWLEDNEGKHKLESVSIYGIITEYVRKLR